MDCDKNEATRLKLIAESKFEQKDFLGAKKYALIAQTLCPELYCISQLLTTLDVYLSAEKKIISGEVDWYGVLDVNPSDDYATIKKKYKKLALMLHPDKNSSVGADGGFQLILEASMMLLDNEKRAAYDERRGYKGFEQKVPTHTGGPSAPCRPHPNEVPENNDSQSVPNSGYKGFEQKVPTHTGGPSAPCRPHPNEVPEYNDSQSVPNQQKVPSAAPRRSQKKVPSAPPRPRQKKGPAHTSGPSAPPQPGRHKARVHTSGPSVPPQQKFSIDDRFFDLASWEASIPKSQNRNAKPNQFLGLDGSIHFETCLVKMLMIQKVMLQLLKNQDQTEPVPILLCIQTLSRVLHFMEQQVLIAGIHLQKNQAILFSRHMII